MNSWLELGKQQRTQRNGVYLDGIVIVPGHEPVPVRAPNTWKELLAKPTARGARDRCYSLRPAIPSAPAIYAGMHPSARSKNQRAGPAPATR